MHMYQRRRPSPIIIIPRQEPTPSGNPKGPESPESPDTPLGAPESPDSPDSPDFPSPIASTFLGSQKPASPTSTAAPTVAPNVTPVSTQLATTSQALASSMSVPAQQITQAPSSIRTAVPTNTNVGAVPDSDNSSKKGISSAPAATTEMVDSYPISTTAAELDNEPATKPSTLPQKQAQHQARTMSVGAEAALITCSVLGALALIIGAIIMIKRRRRKNASSHLTHAPDAFDPSNTGSLHLPETVHIAPKDYNTGSHFTASTRVEPIFSAGTYVRPDTVSTTENSRIAPITPPQPTPNPFADPSLSKSYDVLRGRPRSTTLTDRGSWVDNPFKDPMSGRFDPFGELQQKARDERKRYVEELKREDDVRREQEMLAKERMGLGFPERNRLGE